MIEFQWFRKGELVSIKPHLAFKLNNEGVGFKFIEFMEGGYKSIYSRSIDHLIKIVTKKFGKNNLEDFKDELIRQAVLKEV